MYGAGVSRERCSAVQCSDKTLLKGGGAEWALLTGGRICVVFCVKCLIIFVLVVFTFCVEFESGVEFEY